MFNKHTKNRQPLISSFFPVKSALDNETREAELFQIKTRNRFSVLINEYSKELNDLDNIVNLSDRILTEQEREILNKCLNFCPTPVTLTLVRYAEILISITDLYVSNIG